MGDPRKQRKKYSTPTHPWKAERIISENEICKKYGLRNKREVWRAKSTIGRIRQQARQLLGSTSDESKKESQNLISKLNKLGILEGNSLDDVLALTVDDVLERRLQTIVVRLGLANTPGQARQLIVHKKVIVSENIVDVPSYKVTKSEEDLVHLKEGVVIEVPKKKKSEKPAEAEKKPEEKKSEKPAEAENKKADEKPEAVEEPKKDKEVVDVAKPKKEAEKPVKFTEDKDKTPEDKT